MPTTICRGLPANWLNAWLAAVGIAVLIPDVRLSWTTDTAPVAELTHDGPDPLVTVLARAIPTHEQLLAANSALAFPAGTPKNQTSTISAAQYQQRAGIEREHFSTCLACSVTDLASGDQSKALEKSPFTPAASGQAGGVIYRLGDCLGNVPADSDRREERVSQTLNGRARRVAANGLGFDIQRFPAGVHAGAGNYVDPIIEFLAYTSLALFPIRGNGQTSRTRGWEKGKMADGSFAWPAWRDQLDRWAIDALLDRFNLARYEWGTDAAPLRKFAAREGVTAAFNVVPFQASGSDMTRGYGSRTLL